MIEWPSSIPDHFEIIPNALLGGKGLVVGYDGDKMVLGVAKELLVKEWVQMASQNINEAPEDLRQRITFVALLATTEHTTALNARKSMVSREQLDPERELAFLDALQASPLRRHPKSEGLWAYRYWLLHHDASLTDPLHEFRVVARAGCLHPNNYYAWSYLRHLGRVPEFRPMIQDLCQMHPNDISMRSFCEWLS